MKSLLHVFIVFAVNMIPAVFVLLEDCFALVVLDV